MEFGSGEKRITLYKLGRKGNVDVENSIAILKASKGNKKGKKKENHTAFAE